MSKGSSVHPSSLYIQEINTAATKAAPSTMRTVVSSKLNKSDIMNIRDNKEKALADTIRYLSSFKGEIDSFILESQELIGKLHLEYKGSSDLYNHG